MVVPSAYSGAQVYITSEVVVIGGLFPIYWIHDRDGSHNFIGKRGVIAHIAKKKLLGHTMEIRDPNNILGRKKR